MKFKEQQPAKFRHRLKSLPWLGGDRMEDIHFERSLDLSQRRGACFKKLLKQQIPRLRNLLL